jgi:hypothetical protein
MSIKSYIDPVRNETIRVCQITCPACQQQITWQIDGTFYSDSEEVEYYKKVMIYYKQRYEAVLRLTSMNPMEPKHP